MCTLDLLHKFVAPITGQEQTVIQRQIVAADRHAEGGSARV